MLFCAYRNCCHFIMNYNCVSMSIPLIRQGLGLFPVRQSFQVGKNHIWFACRQVVNRPWPCTSSAVGYLNMDHARSWSSTKKAFSIESESIQGVSQELDIIIAGGGLVGSALACALGKEPSLQDLKIMVLEAGPRREPETPPEEYSNRVISITPGSKRLLESIGAWKHIVQLRQKPYSKMHVWDSCGAGHITFDAAEYQDVFDDEEELHMAHIIENIVVLSALAKELKELDSNVQVEYKSKIKDIKFPFTETKSTNDPVFVELEDGRKFSTKLLFPEVRLSFLIKMGTSEAGEIKGNTFIYDMAEVLEKLMGKKVGADGFNSTVRQKANMEYFRIDYDQTAVVATLHMEEEMPNDVAWQRFLPTGPIAMLPLSENRSSLVWSTSHGDAKALMKLPKETFVDAVNNAFWEDIDRHPLVDASGNWFQNVINIIQPGSFSGHHLENPPSVCDIDCNSRAMYPLGLGHSHQYVNHRLALVGDAAHRVHPLAGQGVNLGAGDVACLRDVLVDAVQLGEDIGHLDHLLTYETKRQREIIPMMSAIDGLKRLFSTSLPPVVLARTLGLKATNAIKPLKDQIMNYAMK